jgi:NAD-dependent dihydropyrimidine dehydrogenase PreA subunit
VEGITIAVVIDVELCNGCGLCVKYCPMDVIRMDEESQKAVTKYLEDCMLCELCVPDCPTNAITVTPVKTAPLMVSWG